MSRTVEWRIDPPPVVQQRLKTLQGKSLKLVDEPGATSFVVVETGASGGDGGVRGSGRRFFCFLGDRHSCSCGESDLCEHLLFVLVQVLGASTSDPLTWQLSLKDHELDKLLSQRTTPKVRSRARKPYIPSTKRRRRGLASAGSSSGVLGRSRGRVTGRSAGPAGGGGDTTAGAGATTTRTTQRARPPTVFDGKGSLDGSAVLASDTLGTEYGVAGLRERQRQRARSAGYDGPRSARHHGVGTEGGMMSTRLRVPDVSVLLNRRRQVINTLRDMVDEEAEKARLLRAEREASKHAEARRLQMLEDKRRAMLQSREVQEAHHRLVMQRLEAQEKERRLRLDELSRAKIARHEQHLREYEQQRQREIAARHAAEEDRLRVVAHNRALEEEERLRMREDMMQRYTARIRYIEQTQTERAAVRDRLRAESAQFLDAKSELIRMMQEQRGPNFDVDKFHALISSLEQESTIRLSGATTRS